MKIALIACLLSFILLFATANSAFAQNDTYSCQNEAYTFLQQALGTWKVITKDRTSPGEYESNTGKSTITALIPGCGIKESYRGIFRGKDYAREVMIVGHGATAVEMSVLDSEHSSFSILKGEISMGQMVVYWYRNEDVKKLQSKYIMTFSDENHFEFSSYLSTDHGATWALTHQRVYSRKG